LCVSELTAQREQGDIEQNINRPTKTQKSKKNAEKSVSNNRYSK
jgi:hypothetical protein